MSQVITIGCDLHDDSMVLAVAVDNQPPQHSTFGNSPTGRKKMIDHIKRLEQRHDASRVAFAYEASGLGFGLADLLDEEGIECHVLSPHDIPKSNKEKKRKTDVRDAEKIGDQLRSHILAGTALSTVWIPPMRLRQDRELVRARVDIAHETTRAKTQLVCFFKRYELPLTKPTRTKWTKKHIAQLRKKLIPELDETLGAPLETLLARLETLFAATAALDKAIARLAKTDRYKEPHRQLRKMPGVGLLTAMCFLTEMGDLTRFENRRQIAAYLGLVPSSNESGKKDDRKGRITRQGSSRLRKMLCQAAWASIRYCQTTKAAYHRIRQNQKHRTKKAAVAIMRKLGIRMWHVALAAGVSTELTGRGDPASLKKRHRGDSPAMRSVPA